MPIPCLNCCRAAAGGDNSGSSRTKASDGNGAISDLDGGGANAAAGKNSCSSHLLGVGCSSVASDKRSRGQWDFRAINNLIYDVHIASTIACNNQCPQDKLRFGLYRAAADMEGNGKFD